MVKFNEKTFLDFDLLSMSLSLCQKGNLCVPVRHYLLMSHFQNSTFHNFFPHNIFSVFKLVLKMYGKTQTILESK